MSRISVRQGLALKSRSQTGLIELSERVQTNKVAVTGEEGARMLSIVRATLYKSVMQGEIESFTIVRARRIAISTLELYARAHR